MALKIVTIGVYGFEKDAFFQALVDAQVDTFCDIRARRAVRGSTYAFANSKRLQQSLQELGIRYLYCKELTPDRQIRKQQMQADKQLGIAKRARSVLGQPFIEAYEQTCLSHFDSQQFVEQLGAVQVVCLLCVEREPEACHRSLVARRLAEDLGLSVEHIKP